TYNDCPIVIDATGIILDTMLKKMKMSRSAFAALAYTMHSGGKRSKRTYSNKRINPSNTAISRRRPEVGRGKEPVKKGRPIKRKRPHQLSTSVLNNQANPKKH
ncbi:unnamed protein product, partial [Meganyctiphanes norvegica]